MKKNLTTLVEDIYQTVTDITGGNKEVPDKLLNELGQKIARTIKTWSTPQHHNKFKLRMSNIGRPARQLYYSQKDTQEIKHHASTQIKFLYGHIMEDLLIFLTKLSGHSVTDQALGLKNLRIKHLQKMIRLVMLVSLQVMKEQRAQIMEDSWH